MDLLEICDYYNIPVSTVPLIDNVFGYIQKKVSLCPPKIVINIIESETRQRFTLAHELGHFFEREYANDLEYVFVEYRGSKYDIHEFFADEFAYALLVPESKVRELLKQGKNVRDIAKYFGVSANVVRKRLERLEYIDSLK